MDLPALLRARLSLFSTHIPCRRSALPLSVALDVLCCLPRKARLTLLLVDAGWSYAQVARLLDCDTADVKALRYEAREQIKAVLDEVGTPVVVQRKLGD